MYIFPISNNIFPSNNNNNTYVATKDIYKKKNSLLKAKYKT